MEKRSIGATSAPPKKPLDNRDLGQKRKKFLDSLAKSGEGHKPLVSNLGIHHEKNRKNKGLGRNTKPISKGLQRAGFNPLESQDIMRSNRKNPRKTETLKRDAESKTYIKHTQYPTRRAEGYKNTGSNITGKMCLDKDLSPVPTAQTIKSRFGVKNTKKPKPIKGLTNDWVEDGGEAVFTTSQKRK